MTAFSAVHAAHFAGIVCCASIVYYSMSLPIPNQSHVKEQEYKMRRLSGTLVYSETI
jgi:hypothetical protein